MDTKDLIQRLRLGSIDDDLLVAAKEAADALEAMSKDAEMWRSWRERALKAEEENRRLLKDAQRYRWLRDGNNTKGSPAMWIAQNHYGMDWDAAIDAAIAKDMP